MGLTSFVRLSSAQRAPGTEVFIGFQPKGVELPMHLGMKMLNEGYPVIIDLEGEKFVFNDS